MNRKISLEALILAIALVAVSAVALADWTQGIAAFNSGNYQVAAGHFTETTRSNPTWPGGYYMLGRCQSEMGSRPEAILSLQKAFELDPSDTDTIIALGQELMADNRYSETRTLLEEADSEAMPPALHSQATILLASAMLAEGKKDAAVIHLEERIVDDNANPALFRALGKAQEASGNQEEAFRSYSKAFELDHDEASGEAAIRTALSLAGRTTVADQRIEWYRQALGIGTQLAKLFPKVEHHLVTGHAAFGAEEFEAAEHSFRVTLTMDESNATVWYSLARTLGELDRADEAYDAFSRALDAAPDDAMARRIHSRMGQIAACRLDLESAAAHYRSAHKPDRAEEIESLATEFAGALTQLERLRATVKEIRLMGRELEELGDDQGVTAMRERAVAEQTKIREIEKNLEAVRNALCR